ncbi:transposase, partial [Candidatus Auribacterota bacterium]
YNVGRTGKSRHAILRALIVKHLERIDTIPQLLTFLDAHPMLTEMCGFNLKSLPHPSQFYRFLKTTKNSSLQNIHTAITKELIAHGIATTNIFFIDSKPVMAASRENNFKNPKRNTYDKTKQPKRNPAATLSYYSYQSVRGKKDNFIFFWGYRTHVIVSKEGIPLVEITLPNNATDAKVARKLIKKLKRLFGLKKESIFIADAAYDERNFYNFIVDQLKCQAFIPINPRNQQEPKTFGPHGCPLCAAKLEMKSAGSWTENLRTRLKFRCPIKTNKTIATRYSNQCPISHPLFASGAAYGCTKYLDITNDARSQVPRDTPFFKTTYNLRTEVERYFSRLGNREVEQTTHYKIQSVKNQMTIAHLSLGLVAYATAITANQPDNIRCYRTFADHLNPLAA